MTIEEVDLILGAEHRGFGRPASRRAAELSSAKRDASHRKRSAAIPPETERKRPGRLHRPEGPSPAAPIWALERSQSSIPRGILTSIRF
jgi:hypothetical protein